MVDKKARVLLLSAGSLCLLTIILSVYSIATTDWSTLGLYHIGLFQTCSNSQCNKNQYDVVNYETESPPVFSTHLFNAGPLSIASVLIQFGGCVLCFFTTFIYLPPLPSLTCYITPLIIFIAFILQFVTITEASYGIHLNGKSAFVFEAALTIQIIAIILTAIAADRIHKSYKNEYV